MLVQILRNYQRFKIIKHKNETIKNSTGERSF